MEQYRILAECLLPNHMLDWFELKDVQVKAKGDTQIVPQFGIMPQVKKLP